MKNLFLFLFVCCFLLSSCKDDTGNIIEGKGNIVIKSSTNSEVENIITRAGEYAAYWVDIAGPQSVSSVLSEEGSFEVLSGNYQVTLTSIANHESALPAFDCPVYQGSTTVVVPVDGSVTANIECTQINAGIRFVFDQSVKDFFTGLVVKLEDTDNTSKSIEYTNDEKTGYFMPATLKMTLKDNGETVKISGADDTTFEVNAKELWTITLKTSNVKPGSIEMTVAVDNSVDEQTPEFGIGIISGEGTLDDPYTVSDAINAMPVEGTWIEGYILSTITRASNAVLLAPKAEGAENSECILIDVPANSAISGLPAGTVLKLKGDVAGATDGTLSTIAYMSNISDFRYEGAELGPNNGNPISVYGQTLKDGPITMGAIIRNEWTANSDYVYLLNRDFTRVTAEYDMTIAYNSENKNQIAAIVDFATENQLSVHGRSLIWDRHFPASMISAFTSTQLKAVVKTYITDVVGGYPTVKSWDVVTEAYTDAGELNTGVAYYNKLGATYIKTAFTDARAAAAADCKLFYDESGLVGNITKLNAVIAAMTALNADGTQLIDGIGVQMNLTAGTAKADIKATIDAITNAGFIVHVSSLQVTGNDESLRAQTYKDVFDCMKEVPDAQNWGITLAGVSDQFSATGSLLFDETSQARQAYFEMINSFK